MSTELRSFREDFLSLVECYSNNTAIYVEGGLRPTILTYKQLFLLVSRCLSLYTNLGLNAGDTLISLMPNSVEAVICFFAAILGGFRYAPLPCTISKRELSDAIKLYQPTLCINSDLLSEELKSDLTQKKCALLTLPNDAQFSWLPETSREDFTSKTTPILCINTSGTTGKPKAMIIDVNRLWSSGYAFAQFHDLLDTKLRYWNYLPMSYLGGLFNLLLIPLTTGGSVVIDTVFSGNTFLRFWQTIERCSIDALWLVPTIARGLLTLAKKTDRPEELKKHQIKIAFLGTAPISIELKQDFENIFDIKLYENFGLSETTFISTETAKNIKQRSQASVGQILPYVQTKLVPIDNNGAKELYVKSPYMFLGYLNESEHNIETINVDDYYPTGDLANIDRGGNLIITGRRRDIIKKGGYLIVLREIEQTLEKLPIISEAAAVASTHSFYGESYHLFITLSNKDFLDDPLSEVNKFIHQSFTQHKWPDKLHIVDELPKTASGKLKKHLLLTD